MFVPKTAQIGKEILPFEMGYLPDFFQKKAEMELNETPENRKIGLKSLKELMENDKLFRGLNLDDDFLLQYLRCRKFNVMSAFTRLKAFVNFKKKYTALFKDLYFENISVATKNKIATFLPYRCQDGCAILLVKFGNWIPDELPIEEVRRMIAIIILQSLRDPMTQVNGIKVIFDFQNSHIRQLTLITPHNLFLLYYGTQEYAPGRFKGIHLVNKSFILKAALAILNLFLSTKLKERLHIHNTPEELLDFFPAAAIPVEYGGELKDYDMTDWLEDVMSQEKLATLGGGNY